METIFFSHRIARVGGMERATTEVANRLANRAKVRLVAAIAEADRPDVQVTRIPLPKGPAMLRSAVYSLRARRVINQHRNDLLISVGSAAWPVDVMIVQFCHAAFAELPRSIRPHSLYQRFAGAMFRVEEQLAVRSRRLKGMIAVSRGVASDMERHYAFPESRIRIVPNGVDHNNFHPATEAERIKLRKELGLDPGRLTAIFVGGDWSRKGLSFVMQALRDLPGVQLLVVGSGGKERPAFEALARELGISKRVNFAGRSNFPADYYRAADVLALPTYYEALSLVSLEAAASGLPLIMPPVNGTEELLQDGVNGFLCERSAGGVGAALLALDSDRDRLRQMGEAAYRASLGFSWERVTERFAVALSELTGWQPEAQTVAASQCEFT